jgi:hypothetical protein
MKSAKLEVLQSKIITTSEIDPSVFQVRNSLIELQGRCLNASMFTSKVISLHQACSAS